MITDDCYGHLTNLIVLAVSLFGLVPPLTATGSLALLLR